MMIKKDKDIKKSALDFGGDVRSLILTLVNAAINEEVNR
jgi:predicted secreted Zn-dependent protease